jgi:predicted MFS family arabinose efflux permease
MVLGAIAQLIAALIVPLVVLFGTDARDLPLIVIYAAGLGVTAGRVFVDAAAFGAIARLVGDGHFVEGQSALSFVWSMGFLLGPALGGALIGLVGAENALWVQAAGFAVAIALLSSMRVDLGPGSESRDARDGLSAGLMMVFRDPMLRLLTAVGTAWNLAVNMIYALLVVFARGELGAGAAETGWMLAIGGGAGLLGGLSAPAVQRRFGIGIALRGALIASAFGAIGLALSRDVVAGTLGFSLLEGSGLLFITLLIGQRQTLAGAHEQGRVGMTGRMAALLAATLGGLLASALVAHLSPSQVFALSAIATSVVAVSAQRLLRAL